MLFPVSLSFSLSFCLSSVVSNIFLFLCNLSNLVSLDNQYYFLSLCLIFLSLSLYLFMFILSDFGSFFLSVSLSVYLLLYLTFFCFCVILYYWQLFCQRMLSSSCNFSLNCLANWDFVLSVCLSVSVFCHSFFLFVFLSLSLSLI
jgi:hypothetical protein